MRTNAFRPAVIPLLATACLLLAAPATALIPATVAIEGVLQSSGGGPAADGDYAVTFALYKDAVGGNALWTEGPVSIAVKNGQFSYALGTKTALTQQVLATAGAQAYLGVQIGSDPELARKPMNSVVTALRSAVAENLECSGCIGLGHLNAEALSPYAKTADLAKVAVSGKFSDLEGGPDLSAYAKTAALAKVAFSGAYADLTGVPDLSVYAKAGALATVATSGKYADLEGAPTLAKVAASGKYTDLTDTPTMAKLDAACGTGLVLKGLKADGSYDCVVAMDPAGFPGDALNEISNGLLTNEFTDTASGGAGVKIPDNNPVGVSDTIDFPDVGIAKKLTVAIDITNSKVNTLNVFLYDSENKEYQLHKVSGSGTSLKTSYPAPTKTVSGDLTTWIGKNPKGKWFLKVIDTDYLNNATDGQINSWSISIETMSSKKVQVKGDLLVDGSVKVGADTTACTSLKAGTQRYSNGRMEYCNGSAWGPVGQSGNVFRWNVFDNYSPSASWMMGNDGQSFGGIAPSNWVDGNYRAVHISADKEVQRTLFSQRMVAGKNAMVYVQKHAIYWSSTDGRIVATLFRIRNTTGSAINWTPAFYFSAYGSWNEWAGVSLNGSEIWSSGGNNYWWTATSVTLSIPANRTSTVIINATSGPPWNYYGNVGERFTVLAFINNSLAMPTGLQMVDDLDSAAGGWEQ